MRIGNDRLPSLPKDKEVGFGKNLYRALSVTSKSIGFLKKMTQGCGISTTLYQQPFLGDKSQRKSETNKKCSTLGSDVVGAKPKAVETNMSYGFPPPKKTMAQPTKIEPISKNEGN